MNSTSSVARSATTFVIGAGASVEANLPAGDGLRDRIAALVDFHFERGLVRSGDRVLFDALNLAASETQSHSSTDCIAAGRRIAAAMPQALSIDNFIDVNADDFLVETCGKLAIVKAILAAEASSYMRLRQYQGRETLSFKDGAKSYFSSLFQLITENCRFTSLSERLRSLRFIVFNYDRCLEHYLFYAIQNYYAVTEAAAAEALLGLQVFHPYGTVGALPWQRKPGVSIALGAELDAQHLLRQARGIRTFSEGTNPASSDIDAIRSALSASARVVFLGFAFHRMNIRLLAPDIPSSEGDTGRQIFATAVDISQSDIELLRLELAARLGTSPARVVLGKDLRCFELFAEYRRSLSLTSA